VLTQVGEQARKDLEALLGCQVFLRTWVKVKENWMHDAAALKQLGFG
jgi:GTP-binding protein Era